MKIRYILTLFAIVIFLCHSCDPGEICKDSIEAYANTKFYKSLDGALKDTTFGKFIVRGIQNPDTIPSDTLSNVNALKLPLPQGIDSCMFVFSFAVYDSVLTQINDSTIKLIRTITHYVDDTIKLKYSRQLYLISADCGFAHLFDLKNISSTNNLIQSVKIVNSEIETSDEENIRILF